MKTRDIDEVVTSSNPVTKDAISHLSVEAGEDELLAEIMAAPSNSNSDEASGISTQKPRGQGWSPRWYFVLAGTGLAALAVGLVFINGSSGPSSRPATAYGAELVRFAEASPLVTMGAPGWHVTYANEDSTEQGEMSFQLGKKPIPEETIVVQNGKATGMLPAATHQREANLNWRSGTLKKWVRDRKASADLSTKVSVLGENAQVYRTEGGKRGDLDITALWTYEGRVLEFSSSVPSMAAFEERLASLKQVDVNTWLAAMPASVIKSQDQSKQVAAMLKGIPLPNGFDASKISTKGLTTDRYQLGAAVAGSVACTWFKNWSTARKSGDAQGVKNAVGAMATAKDWPILREMKKEGDYTDAVVEYAAAMPSGKWYGRPLLADVDSGLGCSYMSIPLK